MYNNFLPTKDKTTEQQGGEGETYHERDTADKNWYNYTNRKILAKENPFRGEIAY